MPTPILKLEPSVLTWTECLILGMAISEDDRRECLEGDPYRALASGTALGGEAFTAIKGPAPEDILGAFGWTDIGTIWSLWRKLSMQESRAVLAHTPLWVRSMVTNSGRAWLYNHVHSENVPALTWLRASKCFDIKDKSPLHIAHDTFYPIRTKPLEELPS